MTDKDFVAKLLSFKLNSKIVQTILCSQSIRRNRYTELHNPEEIEVDLVIERITILDLIDAKKTFELN